MGVGIHYFYHGFELKAFEGRHIRIEDNIELCLEFINPGTKDEKSQKIRFRSANV